MLCNTTPSGVTSMCRAPFFTGIAPRLTGKVTGPVIAGEAGFEAAAAEYIGRIIPNALQAHAVVAPQEYVPSVEPVDSGNLSSVPDAVHHDFLDDVVYVDAPPTHDCQPLTFVYVEGRTAVDRDPKDFRAAAQIEDEDTSAT